MFSPEVAADVVPLDPVVVLVVEDGEAGLVVPLLQALQGQAHGVRHLRQLAGLQALVVVGLGLLQPGRKESEIGQKNMKVWGEPWSGGLAPLPQVVVRQAKVIKKR